MKRIRRWMTGIQIFIGVGAVGGGISAVLNPDSPLGISSDDLKSGPFSSYLIPGLFLLIILGLGNLAGALITVKNKSFWGLVAGLLGCILMAWIAVQCLVLWSVGALHIFYFVLGAVQGLLAFVYLYRENRFPASIVRKIIGR